jgi:endonuclease G, mitochondrial
MAARAFLFASLVLLLSAPAFADCADEYYGGAAPRLSQNQAALSSNLRELCYDDFAVGHSALSHTPLWSAEHLTANEIDAAATLQRRDAFHAEASLPDNERAELIDYRRSGYDRGHMTPSGDMPTPHAQAQSFSLANMVPQAASLNRGLWEEIEVAVRHLAWTDNELFVVTGPIFDADGERLNGRVRVPRALFKAVYDPRRGQAGAYVADNAAGAGYRVVSIAQLTAIIGLDVFPSLPASIKARAGELPAPDGRERRSSRLIAARNREPASGRILTAVSRFKSYFSDSTTSPDTASVTPRPLPRSSSVSRKVSRVATISDRASARAAMSVH